MAKKNFKAGNPSGPSEQLCLNDKVCLQIPGDILQGIPCIHITTIYIYHPVAFQQWQCSCDKLMNKCPDICAGASGKCWVVISVR